MEVRCFYSTFLSAIREFWWLLRYFLMFLESQGGGALRGKLNRTVMEIGREGRI